MKLLTVVGIIIATLITVIFKFVLYDNYFFRSLAPHTQLQDCIKIKGLIGAEDIDIDFKSGVAYLSTADHRGMSFLMHSREMGRLLSYDIRTRTLHNTTLINWPDNQYFHPHGLSLYRDETKGVIYIYVVNHRRSGGDAVEIFRVKDPQTFEHIKTFSHALFHCANDLTLVNEDEFYITKYKANCPYDSKWGDFVEKMTHAWNGFVVYCDIAHNECRIVAQPYSFPNGIVISQDKKTVYMVTSLTHSLHVFTRNASTNSLYKTKDIFFDSALDNISMDEDGCLWIAGHPKPLHFELWLMNFLQYAPSQIFKQLSPHELNFIEVHLSDGEDISGASVATNWKGHILIGSVRDDHILHSKWLHDLE
jgi:arylesterase/paraoxonase